jgi:hypothetical protein
MYADYEQAWTRLRQKANSIHYECAYAVPGPCYGVNERREITPLVGTKSADDVFENDDLGGALQRGHFADQLPERPEGAAPNALQASTRSGQRQILARERTPHEIRNTGQILDAEIGYVFNFEFFTAKICPVYCRLLIASLIRKCAAP